MSNPGIDQGSDDQADALAAVATRWNGDSRIGPLLSTVDRAFLIFDPSAEFVLHASPAALQLRDGIAAADGRLDAALGLSTQIHRAGLDVERPVLARLQLDRRRLKPQVTCLVVQAPGRDGMVIALFPVGQIPRLRPFAETKPTAQSVLRLPSHEPRRIAEPEPSVGPDIELAPGSGSPPRFTWRSDGNGCIRAVSGPAGPVVRAVMAGRSWHDLAQSRVLADAEGLLAALAERRTFRAIPLVLRRPGSSQPLEVEVSGAPLARADQPFAGYGGFGLLRPLAVEELPTEDPLPVEEGSDVQPEPAAVVLVSDENPAPQVARGHTDDEAPALADSLLSGDEHDAFREIARALGARFSGDALPDVHRPEGPGAAVMPFPRSAMRAAEAPSRSDAADGGTAAILDRLPAAVLICRDGVPLFANRSLLDLTGFESLAEIDASGGLTRLFHGLSPEDLTRSDTPVPLARREGGSIEVSVKRSTIVWEEAAAELVMMREAGASAADPATAALQVARAMAQDVAVRRSGEASAVLDSLEDGILAVDPGGRILSLNRRAAAMFGLDPREVVGGGIASLFAPESAAEILMALREPDAAEAKPRRVFAKGGAGLLPVSLRLLALRQGPERRVVLVLREAPRPAEDQAEAGRRAAEATSALRSEVLAKISHEIRTPMTGILGFADVMLAEQFGPFENERYRECLHDIRASGEHVLNVVTDLLDLASIEAGRRDLAFTDVPLNEIVSNCVTEMQPQAARDRIVIRTSFSQNLTRLVADERSVRQAALYVISNALRFTEAGGQVIVSTTMADRGEIALRVRDTGIGMTPDEIAAALEPYRDSGTTFPKSGTGLGLTITKALVEANHGRFRITSRKDEGTLVEMLFPTEQALSA